MQNERQRLRSFGVLPLSFCILHFAFCISASAQVTVTLPLQGYYHPGRYMPVHVAVPSALPTTENLCRAIHRLVVAGLPQGKLDRIRIEETENNFFEYAGEAARG